MKLFLFFLFFIIYSTSIHSTEIATFKLSYIIDNSIGFNEFMNKLDSLKTRMQNELMEDENKLIDKKSKIEESKMIFSETEYNQQIEDFNNSADLFKEKFDEFNNHINMNIEKNKKILIDEIVEITKILSLNNNIDIILNEDQYFLATDNMDISNLIIEVLNTKKLDFKIIELP